jgi:PAS domain S-box-containing protein
MRTALELGLTCLLAMGTLSIILAPLWATRLARPIHAITTQANQLAKGEKVTDWPDSPVIELNQLSRSLADMFDATQQREQELQAIFDASPAGMIVADMSGDGRFIRANDAIVEIFGYPRDELLTYAGKTLMVWKSPENRKQFIAQLHASAHAHLEAWMRRKDGTEFLANLSARLVEMSGQCYVIWVVENITEYHRIEQEVRELNAHLEARVQLRTGQLSAANAELSTTIEHLKIAQGELVRTEKLASLGSLVAGVAHELNTPIGNSVMAVSTMRNALRLFREESANGLKRSVLDGFVEAVDTGSTITERNLARAADLISSFKQVAADQTSSQRRSFKLDEVIREIALTLGPTLRHSVAQLSVDIPPDIEMDSYPGPLGQIVTNLIINATVHAFGGRTQGSITVQAAADKEGVRLRIDDDGVGIPPDLLPRIFDPFVTTRMGSGGTGLGLHIAHNIAVQVLGGTISVSSPGDGGTRFELNIPLTAPGPASRQV